MKTKILSILLVLCMVLSTVSCKKTGDIDVASPHEENEIVTQSGDGNTGNSSTSITGNGNEDSLADISDTVDKKEEIAQGSSSYKEDEYGSIIETGDYIIQGAVTNDNGFIPDGAMKEYVSGEGYADTQENAFIKTEDNSVSTFAADVDTASYANIRRMLTSGDEVNPNAVRVEEMINYFSYDYKKPENDQPFAVTSEIFDCPWNTESKLVRIGLATDNIDYNSMPESNLVFLIDVSGSMDTPDKLPLVKQAFSMLSENLKPTDRISIVTYASSDRIVIDGVKGSDQVTIQTAIENLTAGGGTYGSKGIITAYEIAEKHFIKGGNNRVILATDGDLNIGVTDNNELKDLITEKKKNGVFLSVMGFGTGNLMDDKLETLADNGNGNYNYIDSSLEARRVLVEEMGGTLLTVAKDVKLQVEFDKQAVKEYRLIGYENRIMASQDFEDDSKDGGEIGAGHRLTVLYEIKTADITCDNWLTLNIRHKQPDGDNSILNTYQIGTKDFKTTPSEDSIFAASVAQFGMLLKNSKYVSGTYADIKTRIETLDCIKTDPYKQEFFGFVTSKL